MYEIFNYYFNTIKMNEEVLMNPINFCELLDYVTRDAAFTMPIQSKIWEESYMGTSCIAHCLKRVKECVEKRRQKPSQYTEIVIDILCAETGFSKKFVANACRFMSRIEFPVIVYTDDSHIVYYNSDDIKHIFNIISSDTSRVGITIDELRQKCGLSNWYMMVLIKYMASSMIIFFNIDDKHIKLWK